MTEIILKDAFISVNGIDLSAQVTSVTLTLGRNMEDGAAMGDMTEVNVPGIKTWSVDVEFNQSFDAALVDATIFPLIDNGTLFSLIIRPSGLSAVGPTNPEFTAATALVASYPPISGAHGSIQKASVSFVPGGGDMVRTTA